MENLNINPAATPASPREKMVNMQKALQDLFVERSELIQGIMAAVLSRQHCFILGPAGTAKSRLCKTVAASISGATYFETLLTKFTTPDEVFGPISLKRLEEDRYERITAGKLPDAHIAFIDEIWKASSAILNALLGIANEREFQNGNGHPTAVPLETILCASNELPESEELNAMYDRFMLRFVVNYVAEDRNFKTMLRAAQGTLNPVQVTYEELKQAQAEVGSIPVHDEIYDGLITIRKKLKEEGIIPSDRRFCQSVPILQANAYLTGKQTVTEDDFSILQHVFWNQPENIPSVRKVILEHVSPFEGKALELYDQATEVHRNTLAESDHEKKCQLGVEANVKFKKIIKEMAQLLSRTAAQGKSTERIEGYKKRIEQLNAEVLHECLGLEV